MSLLNKFFKIQLPLVAGSILVSGAAVAGLSYSFNLTIISAGYHITAPDFQPNLLSNAPVSIEHKVQAVDFNPNEVRVQRRIREGWYNDDLIKHCIHANGSRDYSCAWNDWDVDWQLERYVDEHEETGVFTHTVSIAGSAYANWPLFPADEAAYQENPNWIYYAPKTKFIIETRYEHPTAGWLYSEDSFEVYCNGQRAWKHFPTGQTTCEGL